MIAFGRQRQPSEEHEMATASTLETLLTEHDVAFVTGMSVASVRRWRYTGRGPRYLKIGSAVRYRPEEVTAWIEQQAHSHEATARVAQ